MPSSREAADAQDNLMRGRYQRAISTRGYATGMQKLTTGDWCLYTVGFTARRFPEVLVTSRRRSHALLVLASLLETRAMRGVRPDDEWEVPDHLGGPMAGLTLRMRPVDEGDEQLSGCHLVYGDDFRLVQALWPHEGVYPDAENWPNDGNAVQPLLPVSTRSSPLGDGTWAPAVPQ